MKKILTLVLTLAMFVSAFSAFGISACAAFDLKPGDTFMFGSYEQNDDVSDGKEAIEWIVLDVQGNEALVVSKYALDAKKFNEVKEKTSWEACTLRTWLNEAFFDEAFNEEEKAEIVESTLANKRNEHYDKSVDGNETADKIFLLSVEEAEKYMETPEAKQCQPTEYAEANGAYHFSDTDCCDWWTRTEGGFTAGVAYVKNHGGMEYEGNWVTHTDNAVRPAMRISIG